ncbi:hypothetical protein B0T25DRAFT_364428 [Lasiosphaeria hispida]|uniref:Secreted protein n=1 Tax=Lasiosphaeria hispida TaxID=260671 RepID=A0AAJ0H5E3_9PEZI|nr:hypothetical protein B0T25DRAFT_364428 [Lasiosphaeria hispida]
MPRFYTYIFAVIPLLIWDTCTWPCVSSLRIIAHLSLFTMLDEKQGWLLQDIPALLLGSRPSCRSRLTTSRTSGGQSRGGLILTTVAIMTRSTT